MAAINGNPTIAGHEMTASNLLPRCSPFWPGWLNDCV